MGIISEKWRCPYCDKDVGGSYGDLKSHYKSCIAMSPGASRLFLL